jgi:hypothetical protein
MWPYWAEYHPWYLSVRRKGHLLVSTWTLLSRHSVLLSGECLLAAMFPGNDRMVSQHTETHRKDPAQLVEIGLRAGVPTEIELLSHIQRQQETMGL